MIAMLPRNAKLYIFTVLSAGLAILALAARFWSGVGMKQFLVYLGLVAIASTPKIRIRGIEATITPNFIFLLLAMQACRFSQVIAMSVVAALIQTLWRPAKRVQPVQVAFSLAALVLSTAAAYSVSYLLHATNTWESSVGSVILAGCIYFSVNSALVAMVIGLVSGQTVRQVCSHADVWAFPYFMGGIAFAALISVGYDHSSSWRGAVILIPVAALAHVYFLNRSRDEALVKPSS